MVELSFLDRLIAQAGACLNAIFPARIESHAAHPGSDMPDSKLASEARELSSRLMRVNHAGEISAQGLYQGQVLFARSARVRAQLERAAREEREHLGWCASRLAELGSSRSRLDPCWYLGSVCLGTLASLAGDRTSLGLIAETERQVVEHLDGHLARLPNEDGRSRAILERMRTDEARHGQSANEAGAEPLPFPIPAMMRAAAGVMTTTAYRL